MLGVFIVSEYMKMDLCVLLYYDMLYSVLLFLLGPTVGLPTLVHLKLISVFFSYIFQLFMRFLLS